MKRINPNFVTALRLFLFAPLACLFLSYGHLKLALMVMVLGEFTDWFDGFLARRTNQVSDVGKLLDPLCDTVFHMTIWMTFLSIGWVPLYAVILFFARDAVVSTIRSCLAKHGVALAARKSGKLKAGFQAGAQLALVLSHIFLSGGALFAAGAIVVSLASLITLWSFVDYGYCFFGFVRSKKVVLFRPAAT